MIPLLMPTMISQMPSTAAGNVDVDFGSNFMSFASRKKQKRAFLSPSLVWLEEEGLAAAEKMKKKEMGVVDDFIITSPEVKKEVMTRALAMWRALSTVEKAEWKKRAVEKALEEEKMALEKEEAQEEK